MSTGPCGPRGITTLEEPIGPSFVSVPSVVFLGLPLHWKEKKSKNSWNSPPTRTLPPKKNELIVVEVFFGGSGSSLAPGTPLEMGGR